MLPGGGRVQLSERLPSRESTMLRGTLATNASTLAVPTAAHLEARASARVEVRRHPPPNAQILSSPSRRASYPQTSRSSGGHAGTIG